jgi:uncharacterized damage-inducible protein DinB
MTEIQRIQDQLERAFRGNAWHGPAVLELLADVTAERAAWKPAADVHSIWEIVPHIETWKRVVTRRLAGETFEISAAEDWPPISDTSAAAWRAAIESLKAAHVRLVEAASRTSDAQLNKLSGPISFYVLLHGVTQHDLYHAGQIALLKKLAR